jgi:hypothetical protein
MADFFFVVFLPGTGFGKRFRRDPGLTGETQCLQAETA